MTIQDVAEFQHVTTATVRNWIRQGRLETIELDFGGRKPTVRIEWEAYDRFIQNRKEKER